MWRAPRHDLKDATATNTFGCVLCGGHHATIWKLTVDFFGAGPTSCVLIDQLESESCAECRVISHVLKPRDPSPPRPPPESAMFRAVAWWLASDTVSAEWITLPKSETVRPYVARRFNRHMFYSWQSCCAAVCQVCELRDAGRGSGCDPNGFVLVLTRAPPCVRFVNYATLAEAQDAITQLNQFPVLNERLRVRFALTPEQKVERSKRVRTPRGDYSRRNSQTSKQDLVMINLGTFVDYGRRLIEAATFCIVLDFARL